MKSLEVKMAKNSMISVIVTGEIKFLELYGIKPTDVYMHKTVSDQLAIEVERLSNSLSNSNTQILLSTFDGMKVNPIFKQELKDNIVFKAIRGYGDTTAYLNWSIPELAIVEYKHTARTKSKRLLRPVNE